MHLRRKAARSVRRSLVWGVMVAKLNSELQFRRSNSDAAGLKKRSVELLVLFAGGSGKPNVNKTKQYPTPNSISRTDIYITVTNVCIAYPDVIEIYQISSRDEAKHFYYVQLHLIVRTKVVNVFGYTTFLGYCNNKFRQKVFENQY